MKENELRIGNYINKITTSANDKDLTIVKAEDIFNIGADIDFYARIPLTEKWLLRFRFFEYENNYFSKTQIYAEREKITVSFHFSKNGTDLIIDEYGNSEYRSIYYVHQLQNLYFALTGKELECHPSIF